MTLRRFAWAILADPRCSHVFDEAHLHIILQELDTIRDFSDYLTARERLISNNNLFSAAGEVDLLAVYLKDVNEKGEHDFVWETGQPLKPNQKIAVPEGVYRNYQKAAPYRRKKKADQQSYLWDRLINKFARNLLAGTLAPIPEGIGKDGREGGAELGLRYMALERRVQRRSHANAIEGAFEYLEKQKGNRFFRAMIPEAPEQGDTGFCILLVKREITPEGTSFEDYREFRASNLGASLRTFWSVIAISRELSVSRLKDPAAGPCPKILFIMSLRNGRRRRSHPPENAPMASKSSRRKCARPVTPRRSIRKRILA